MKKRSRREGAEKISGRRMTHVKARLVREHGALGEH